MNIRKYNIGDAEIVSKLICKTLRVVNGPDYSKDAIEELCNVFTPMGVTERNKDKTTFLSFDKTTLTGTISLGKSKDNYDMIFSLFINPDYLKQGLGKLLLNQLENFAKNTGIQKLVLNASITAHIFYLKNGYSYKDDTKILIDNDYLEMCKDL